MSEKPRKAKLSRQEINLAGKDYYTPEEAAAYCGVSISQFDAHKKQHGLVACSFMGKALYRKTDLKTAIEREFTNQCRRLQNVGLHGSSTGRIHRASTASL